MRDLLGALRLVRSIGGLVGFYRHGWFRSFAVWITCVGVGLAIGGANLLGGAIALGLWVVAWTVRTRVRSDRAHYAGRGVHRA